MTRAEEGRFVNLTAGNEADDLYRRVAFRANWFDRATVKRPAMSYFYGSKPGGFSKDKRGRWHAYGMTKQIIDHVLKERKEKRLTANEERGAKKLAHTIFKVIEDMVPRARDVRHFLEELAGLAAGKGKPLRWTTPLGLPVFNIYHSPKIETISVSLNGRRRRVNLVTGDKEGIAKTKAANSVTANFTHSVDAAHL